MSVTPEEIRAAIDRALAGTEPPVNHSAREKKSSRLYAMKGKCLRETF